MIALKMPLVSISTRINLVFPHSPFSLSLSSPCLSGFVCSLLQLDLEKQLKEAEARTACRDSAGN